MSTEITAKKIILPGGAGLVGQNLVAQLKKKGYTNLVVLDKHKNNLEILRSLHPNITAEYADLAQDGPWEKHFAHGSIVVMLQAQIGHTFLEPFVRNNVNTTKCILTAIRKYNVPYTIHISSSVVESVATDYYSTTKEQQENIVLESGIDCIVLRPTLMFGWFDRKHLGWLSRFMKKSPLFPIPGHGQYPRQPLYAGDFCNIIISCIEAPIIGKVFNITGMVTISYIDIIREIKKAVKAKCLLMKIPKKLFYFLLKIWGVFDRNPPFTADQLQALTAGDHFEVIDWPAIFNVQLTSFATAIDETFNHPIYSNIVLEF
jgi:nucleoside-diphosphate-sugar epimerase